MDGSFYNPVNIPVGYNSIGSYGQGNYDEPNGSVVIVKEEEAGALVHPTGYTMVYQDKGSGASMDGSFWMPIPPKGYVAMGLVCVEGYDAPSTGMVVCLRDDLVTEATVGNLIWDDKKSGAKMDGGFWEINSAPGSIQTGVFAGASSHDASNAAPLYGIRHDVA